MKIETTVELAASPKQLAHALVHSSPEEFADFWFEFQGFVENEEIDLLPFAEAMAPNLGGRRKKALIEICNLMFFCEESARRKGWVKP